MAEATATIPDPRATHYWDGIGYAPTYWMQQLTRASVADSDGAWLNGRTFSEHVRTALKTKNRHG